MKKSLKSLVSSAVALITAVSVSISAFAAPSNYYMKNTFDYLTSAEKSSVDNAVAEIAALVNPSWPTINKVLFVHDYLCTHTKYDTTFKHYHTYDNLLLGTSTCQGYSEAFDMIMEVLGIPCHMITSDELNHGWNIVKVDGYWYHVDVTWDDPVPDTAGGAIHKYFLVSDSAMRSSAYEHNASDWTIYDDKSDVTSAYGNCTSTKYDTNAYWKDSNTPIVITTASNYVISNGKIQKYTPAGVFVSTVRDLSTYKWPYFAGSGGYWKGTFSGLGEYGGKLYYNTPTTIERMNPDGSGKEVVFTLSSTQQSRSSIYGFVIIDNKLTYILAEDPMLKNETQATITLGSSETHKHSYTTKVIAPTCTAQGYTLHICACGDSYEDNVTAAKGHSYTTEVITKAATCTAYGSKSYKCSICNTSFTESIKPTGHKYTSTVVAPTTSAEGYTLHTCSACGDSYKDTYTDKLPSGGNDTPITPTAPAAPTATVSDITSSAFTINWNAVANATGYVIEQKVSGVWSAKATITNPATTSYKFTGKSQLTTYYYRVKAVNGSASSAYSNVTLKTLLANPANLTATTTSNSITLKWTANTKATGYVIEQKINGVWSAKANITSGTTNTYTFTGKSANTTYYYRVKAVSGTENSGYSNVTCKTAAATITAPTNVTATTTGDTITIKWNKVTNATGYVIEQKVNGVWSQKAKITSGATTSYKFTGKSQLTTYYYRVKAVNGTQNSGYTNITTKTGLSSPANVTATTTTTAITLKWTANTKATGYVIEQKINGVWSAKATINSRATTSYKFTGKSANTTYYYRIKAVSGTTNSAYTNITCKTK